MTILSACLPSDTRRVNIGRLRVSKLLMSAAAASIVALTAIPTTARAELTACGNPDGTDGLNLLDKVTSGENQAASSCQFLSEPDTNAVASETNVNDAEFFGITDWEENENNSRDDNELVPAALEGSWSINNFDSDLVYMITFKDGQNTNLVSFRLDLGFESGSWTSPFTDPPFDVGNTREVSHFAIFQSTDDDIGGGEQEIPVPATLGLLGFGLLATGVAMRRRR